MEKFRPFATGFFCAVFFFICSSSHIAHASLTEEELAKLVMAPMELGTKDETLPAWRLLDGAGALLGYIFESRDLSPIPGFSGTPMNLLISIDTKGTFLDVRVLDQNEPVFVSGLGPRPFHEFLRQYQGKSLGSNIKVGRAQDKDAPKVSGNVQIDGVTKATASVRIANESILASALQVARERLAGIAPKSATYPRKDLFEKRSWDELVDLGLIKHMRLTNRDIEKLFADSDFKGLDDIANDNPDDLYLDLWIADLGLPTVMGNLLSTQNQTDLNNQLSPFEEAILVLASGRHRLVNDEFVRNSVPDLLGARQAGYPVNIRDGDIEVALQKGVPEAEQAMVFRMDTRLGFDPSSPWEFLIKTVREKGSFQPEVAMRDIVVPFSLPAQYFNIPVEKSKGPAWMSSWRDQAFNLSVLIIFLSALYIGLWRYKILLGKLAYLRPLILLGTLFFIGWSAQGQLSIVTVIAFFKALFSGQSLTFMLYDPFSLVIWVFVIASFFLWGRGTFCGWLCPYGVLQEFSALIAKWLHLPQIRINERVNRVLSSVKYVILFAILSTAFIAPNLSDFLVEVEPFKTAITMQFERSINYVLYATFWLVLSLFLFKGFCRYICPLGAFMAVCGKVRLLNWLPRRTECGTPCQLCRVRCQYQAIEKTTGDVNYTECFQCLECVEIYDDRTQCVPLILQDKHRRKECNG